MQNRKAKHKITFFCKKVSDIVGISDAVSKTFPALEIEVKASFKFYSFKEGTIDDDEHLINVELFIEDHSFDINNNDFQQKVRLMVSEVHKMNSNVSYKSSNTKYSDEESVLGNAHTKRWVPI
jgi:hypothetical protein